jgi:hypothetical protein
MKQNNEIKLKNRINKVKDKKQKTITKKIQKPNITDKKNTQTNYDSEKKIKRKN